MSQFLTPLATAHKFNGFADAFLDNGGPAGLRDVYAYVAPKLPWGLKGSLAYHQFWSDTGTKRGTEVDAVVSRKFLKCLTLLSKFAWYKGQNMSDPPRAYASLVARRCRAAHTPDLWAALACRLSSLTPRGVHLLLHTVRNKVMRRFASVAYLFLSPEKKRLRRRRIRGREDFRKLARADCVVVSFGKSGRTWLRVMLSRYYQLCFGLSENSLIGFDNLHRKNAGVPRIFFTHDNYLGDFTGNTDSKCDFYQTKVVLLVRNPQDVAVSQFFQWKFRMKEHKKVINQYPLDPELAIFDFVMGEAAGIPKICDFMNGWGEELPRMQNILVVRYEDMRADPRNELRKVVEFLEGSANPDHVRDAVEFASVENMRRLEVGSVFSGGRMKPGDRNNPDSFKVRRAKVGGYRDYFDDDQVQRIDALVKDRLSPVFGYGCDDAGSSPGL
jgi:hypothetical protein